MLKKETARAPPQALDVATRDTSFRLARRFQREEIISLVDYFKQINNLYKFEPKIIMLKSWYIPMSLKQLQSKMLQTKILQVKQ